MYTTHSFDLLNFVSGAEWLLKQKKNVFATRWSQKISKFSLCITCKINLAAPVIRLCMYVHGKHNMSTQYMLVFRCLLLLRSFWRCAVCNWRKSTGWKWQHWQTECISSKFERARRITSRHNCSRHRMVLCLVWYGRSKLDNLAIVRLCNKWISASCCYC